MVTDKGCIEIRFRASENINKQLTKKMFIVSVIMLAAGIAILAAYLILSVFFEDKWVDALLAGAIPFTVGLIFVLTVKKEIKNARLATDKEYAYEFYSDGAMFFQLAGGERAGFVKISGNGITKPKETKDYIFFRYAMQVYPVEKAALNSAELNTVKKLLKLPYDETAEVLTLAENH